MAALTDTSLISDANLVAYYPLDVDALDDEGANDLTNNGTTTFDAAKYSNGANGGATNTTKWLSRNANLGIAGNGDMSISFWLKMNTEIGTGIQTLWELNSTTGLDRYNFCYYDYNGGTRTLRYDSAGGTGANYAIALGTADFHHLVFTRNIAGNEAKLYVDGVLRATGTNGTGTSGGGGNGFGLLASESGVNKTSAIMDDVAVFSRVLTLAEVEEIYQDGIDYTATFNDTITASDLLTKSYGFVKTLSETINMSETFIKATAKTLLDTVNITDTISKIFGYTKTFTDSITISDTLTKSPLWRVLSGVAAVFTKQTPQSETWTQQEAQDPDWEKKL